MSSHHHHNPHNHDAKRTTPPSNPMSSTPHQQRPGIPSNIPPPRQHGGGYYYGYQPSPSTRGSSSSGGGDHHYPPPNHHDNYHPHHQQQPYHRPSASYENSSETYHKPYGGTSRHYERGSSSRNYDPSSSHQKKRNYDHYTRRNNDGGGKNNSNKYRKNEPPPLDSNTINLKANDNKVPLRNGIPIWNFSIDHSQCDIKSNGEEQRKRFFQINAKEGTLENPAFASFIEYHRYKKIVQLRLAYENDVKELLFDLEAPKESLNRWLFEQLSSVDSSLVDPLISLNHESLNTIEGSSSGSTSSSSSSSSSDTTCESSSSSSGTTTTTTTSNITSSHDRFVHSNHSLLIEKQSTSDFLLKRPEFALESEVLRAEIYSEIPSRLRCRTINQALTSLDHYYKNGWEWLKKVRTLNQPQLCEQIEQQLKQLRDWMNHSNTQRQLSVLEEKQKELTKNCSILFKQILKDRVDEVCRRLVDHSKKIAESLSTERLKESFTQQSMDVQLEFHEQELLCKVTLYSSDSSSGSSSGSNNIHIGNSPTHIGNSHNNNKNNGNNNNRDLNNNTNNGNDEKSSLSLQPIDTFKLNLIHYNKLRLLYKKCNTERDPEMKEFQYRLYTLIRRYQTFFGDSSSEEGANFHAALPEKGFDFLTREFQVCHECFASPINCYFNSFCSAFPDTDVYFGSRGSFFEFRPTRGFFECGPPYTLEVMNKTARYCLELLKSSNEPLAFAVFVPEWTDTEYGKILHPDHTPFCTGHLLAEQGKHEYVIGMQHFKENDQRYWTLPFPTHVYFLQNEEGKKKWPITPQLIERYKKVMEMNTTNETSGSSSNK
ncbi:hypothetical protein C9374_006750 [Naegleria lovaniensis]|uniref:PCIF1 WW domain-containing protein n=1 Tax=Naegleria lovaniensis TaxID=51637 RepID=A0AA88KJ59_NAELO|nr:uncharacterized protein C9374_006750 [Naegleria lovaniensis]KAG2379633.1 hypothetical protein C9374_006750 [Naegleria lovaniensis]